MIRGASLLRAVASVAALVALAAALSAWLTPTVADDEPFWTNSNGGAVLATGFDRSPAHAETAKPDPLCQRWLPTEPELSGNNRHDIAALRERARCRYAACIQRGAGSCEFEHPGWVLVRQWGPVITIAILLLAFGVALARFRPVGATTASRVAIAVPFGVLVAVWLSSANMSGSGASVLQAFGPLAALILSVHAGGIVLGFLSGVPKELPNSRVPELADWAVKLLTGFGLAKGLDDCDAALTAVKAAKLNEYTGLNEIAIVASAAGLFAAGWMFGLWLASVTYSSTCRAPPAGSQAGPPTP